MNARQLLEKLTCNEVMRNDYRASLLIYDQVKKGDEVRVVDGQYGGKTGTVVGTDVQYLYLVNAIVYSKRNQSESVRPSQVFIPGEKSQYIDFSDVDNYPGLAQFILDHPKGTAVEIRQYGKSYPAKLSEWGIGDLRIMVTLKIDGKDVTMPIGQLDIWPKKPYNI